MTILIPATAVAALLAVFFLLRMFRGVRRRHYLRAGGSGLTCLATAAVAAAGLMLLFSLLSYSRLTGELSIAQIEFRRINPEEFQARLMIPDETDRFFVLRGNEWQLDARIVTWSPPATILGLDPVYQLERLSGRYSEIDREQIEPRTVHSLATGSAIDVWAVARQFPAFVPGIDAYYGTATYVPMADGARFDVSLSRDALIARPANDRARAVVGAWRRTGQ
jgi:hypothetical protein